MPERIQQIITRIRNWWSKFTARQKAIIISAAAVVLIALIILGVVMSRPKTMVLKTATSAKEAQSIQELLQSNNISYTQSQDGMTFTINQDDYAQASILLGTNDIAADGYTINDALDGSFSTTEDDKKKKYQLYLEDKYASQIEDMYNVKKADVNLHIPDDDGTIIASNEPISASVKLDLAGDFSRSQAASMAEWMKTTLGNDTTDQIVIIDNKGNTLFSGDDETSTSGIASSNQEAKQNAENYVADKVRTTLANSSQSNMSIYDNVDIGVNLDMDFSDQSSVQYDYSVDDGRTEGYMSQETYSSSESQGGVAGTPGTDSNDDQTYVIQDSDITSSNTEQYTRKYLPDEIITTTTGEKGKVNYDNSSITVVANNIVTYNEDDMKANGTLDGMTFDEFRAQNSDRTQVDVDDAIVTAVSNATGVPAANISILAYNVPMFEPSESGRSLTDYLEIIIALLVFALLGFVVFRSLRKDEDEEVEEEVSVDDLLAQQNNEDQQLQDIGFNEKSEARVLIEKFVDEQPEAAANLLRNWLNEDWN